MKNKKISQISKIYASAIFDSDYAKIKEQLKQIQETLNSSNELILILQNTSINLDKKIQVLEDIFSNKIDKKLLNLLKLLSEKNRLSEFNSICESFNQLVDERNNIIQVEIVSAIELSQAQQLLILEKLENKLCSKISPIWEQDTDLIAGLIFKLGDKVIDTSVRKKLEQISKR